MSHRETSGSVILKLRISYDSGCHIVTNHILFASVLSMVKHKLYGQSFDRLGYDFMVLCVNKRIQYVLSAWHAGSKTVKENSH